MENIMTTQIYVNLPVKDLDKSVAFFKAVGFKNNPKFTDKTAACMVITDTINVMLLTHAKFKGFTKKPVADAHKTTEVLNCLVLDSKTKVNKLVDKAVAAGGSETGGESQDHDAMFMRAFDDLDGHTWEILWMDASAMEKGAKT